MMRMKMINLIFKSISDLKKNSFTIIEIFNNNLPLHNSINSFPIMRLGMNIKSK